VRRWVRRAEESRLTQAVRQSAVATRQKSTARRFVSNSVQERTDTIVSVLSLAVKRHLDSRDRDSMPDLRNPGPRGAEIASACRLTRPPSSERRPNALCSMIHSLRSLMRPPSSERRPNALCSLIHSLRSLMRRPRRARRRCRPYEAGRSRGGRSRHRRSGRRPWESAGPPAGERAPGGTLRRVRRAPRPPPCP